MPNDATDPKWFREVLSQYPTGVCVVTGVAQDGAPLGITVGSFTSVSLDPPLVGFLPGMRSESWKAIAKGGRFCVNVLGADQEWVCRQFAASGADKFTGIGYRFSRGGSPILDGCVAWIDCELESATEAGDHLVVVGGVRELNVEAGGLPLMFYQGGYGRFMPLSLVAPDVRGDLSKQLRQADTARPEMERLADDIGARCIAMARATDEVVVTASAGGAARGWMPTLVGQYLPFLPPFGALFVAWANQSERDSWIERAQPDARQACSDSLSAVRQRGYVVSLINEAHGSYHDLVLKLSEGRLESRDIDLTELVQQLSEDKLSPAVERRIGMIAAPVFDVDGTVILVLTIWEFEPGDIGPRVARLLEAADKITNTFGGRVHRGE